MDQERCGLRLGTRLDTSHLLVCPPAIFDERLVTEDLIIIVAMGRNGVCSASRLGMNEFVYWDQHARVSMANAAGCAAQLAGGVYGAARNGCEEGDDNGHLPLSHPTQLVADSGCELAIQDAS